MFSLLSTSNYVVIICTPDDALVVRNIWSIFTHKLFHFVKPPRAIPYLDISKRYNHYPFKLLFSLFI